MNDNDKIEQLRVILEHQQSKAVTHEEASEIGESLLIFFRTLGGDTTDGQPV
jgi:hypothetical protein